MMNPTFSIITAVRNGLKDLQHTYISLVNQTSQDFEWIIIDAASTDGTVDWLVDLPVFSGRIRWISEADNGISDAWNKGLALACGQQILFLNAGDVYDAQLVERFGKAAGESHITCCHARIIGEDGRLIGIFRAQPEKLWRGMHLPHNWCSVPRIFYEQFGGYKLMRHSMDFEWFHRYYKLRGVHGFKVLNETLGSYRMGGHSDIHYREGFSMNSEILVANGTPRLIANSLRIAYTMKHKLIHRGVGR